MATAADQVSAAFSRASGYASSAKEGAESFLAALEGTVYAPPTISVTWESIAAPVLDELPEIPSLPAIVFNTPGGTPGTLNLPTPNVDIDDFAEADPTLTFPDAPVISYGSVPTVPSVGEVAVPDAPTIAAVDAPELLSLSTITTPAIDLREGMLTQLENIPTLTLLEPTAYSHQVGPNYASALLDAIKGNLAGRINGGTGLAPAVEQAIWDRARDRETRTAQANIDQVTRSSEALGFQLPSGVLAAQLRDAEQVYFEKLSDLSREIGIKQADLEQANLKDAIAQGLQLEAQLIDMSWKMEQLAFESSKQYAQNAIDVYNAAVEQYKALMLGYQTFASAYKTVIDGELAKVEVYKAELDGEKAKADINKALVEQYKASIEAGMAQVEIYRAQVSAAQTLVSLEQAKIGAAGEQIKAYVAQVNAETARVEAYKAGVTAEVTKVDVYRAKVSAFSAKVGAQGEKARAEISRYSALSQANAAEWEGYRARVGAESERVRALGLQSNALLDGYRAAATATTAKAEMHAKVFSAQIGQYEASKQVALQTAKINNDAVLTTNNARLDAAKVGAQVYAQLASSAYSSINASATVSASAGMSVGYSYSNDTSSTPASLTVI